MDESVKQYIDNCRDELLKSLGSSKLTDEQIDHIAEKAAEKAVSKMTDIAYREIGKSVVSRIFYITGVLSVALYMYAVSKGWIK